MIVSRSSSGSENPRVIQSRITAVVPLGTYLHVAVPAADVAPGMIGILNFDASHADDYIAIIQHCATNEVHVWVLNLARAGGVFDEPCELLIFREL